MDAVRTQRMKKVEKVDPASFFVLQHIQQRRSTVVYILILCILVVVEVVVVVDKREGHRRSSVAR